MCQVNRLTVLRSSTTVPLALRLSHQLNDPIGDLIGGGEQHAYPRRACTSM